MLEMVYSNCPGQYHACWCTCFLNHKTISRHCVDCVGQTACIFVPEFYFIYSDQAKSKIWFKMWIYLLLSLKQFSMLIVNTGHVECFLLHNQSHSCWCPGDASRQGISSLDSYLTPWGRVTHIWVDNLTIIGSDNGLSPGRRQAII